MCAGLRAILDTHAIPYPNYLPECLRDGCAASIRNLVSHQIKRNHRGVALEGLCAFEVLCIFRQLARHRLVRTQLTFELRAMHLESILALKNVYVRAAMRVGVRRVGVRPESASTRIGMRSCAPECPQSAPMRAGGRPERHNLCSKQCKGNSETKIPNYI